MKTFTAISLFIATLIAAVPVSAADQNGMYIAFGRGLQPCNAHLNAYGLNGETLDWIAGFMSAFNIYQPGTFDITAGDTRWYTWIEEYCRFNPAKRLDDAVKAFIMASYDTRLTQQVPTITPPVRQPNLAKNRNLTRDRNQY